MVLDCMMTESWVADRTARGRMANLDIVGYLGHSCLNSEIMGVDGVACVQALGPDNHARPQKG